MIRFEETCRPVIFDNEGSEFPWWSKGSSFLVATSNAYYWVTASHVLRNMGGTAQLLRIFPSDHSKMSLPFNEKYTINSGLSDDEDYKDLFVLRIDVNVFDRFGDVPLAAQDLSQGTFAAEDLSFGDELWIVGYPSETTSINYEYKTFQATRTVLRATYAGESISSHCHKVNVESTVSLNSFDGLSGGPVFRMEKRFESGETLPYPLLAGMLIRGTASSSTAHFVSSRVICSLINLMESNA